MIIKLQSILFPLSRHREERKPVVLTKRDRVNADRVVVLFLFILTIAAAVIFS